MASKRRNMFHKNKTQETTENDDKVSLKTGKSGGTLGGDGPRREPAGRDQPAAAQQPPQQQQQPAQPINSNPAAYQPPQQQPQVQVQPQLQQQPPALAGPVIKVEPPSTNSHHHPTPPNARRVTYNHHDKLVAPQSGGLWARVVPRLCRQAPPPVGLQITIQAPATKAGGNPQSKGIQKARIGSAMPAASAVLDAVISNWLAPDLLCHHNSYVVRRCRRWVASSIVALKPFVYVHPFRLALVFHYVLEVETAILSVRKRSTAYAAEQCSEVI
ncbi:hypothetical protein AAG570_010446 [Ranatra chinensis]|uniref:Uncharacterized protein n=1 Tax=Ranatra chinensis TaxID=642074 RepID=A0ABD0YMJ7_9HEMI